MKIAHIYAYGDVMNIQDAEAAEYGIISLKSVVDVIIANPDAEEIIVHIHSGGGDVYEGFAIHDALKNSGKKITTIIEGLCASIATVIALAGSVRQMTKNSEFMIHNPWSFAHGTADEIQKQADFVRRAEDKLIKFYSEKTDLDEAEIRVMMSDDTFMIPEEAETMGFVTEVLPEIDASKKTMKVYATIKKPKTKTMTKEEKIKAAANKKADDKKAADLKAKKEKKPLTKKDILNKLTAYLDKIDDSVEDVTASIDLTTDDDRSVTIETDSDTPAIGDAVTVDGSAAPNEVLTMTDGTVIETDADSNIESIETAEEETAEKTGTDAKAQATIKKLQAELKAEKKKREDLEAKVTEDSELMDSILEKVEKLEKKNVRSSHTPEPEKTKFKKQNNPKDGEEKDSEGAVKFKDRTKARNEAAISKYKGE